MAVHARLAGGRGGETDEVGLDGARDQNRIGALKPGLAQVELELAHLVPTERQIGAVVPLDVDSRPAQCLAQVGHRFQGRGQAAEPQPRKLAQDSQPRFCRHLELPEISDGKRTNASENPAPGQSCSSNHLAIQLKYFTRNTWPSSGRWTWKSWDRPASR